MDQQYIFIVILIAGIIALISDFILKSLAKPIVIPYMRYSSFSAIIIGIAGWGITLALKSKDTEKEKDELVPK